MGAVALRPSAEGGGNSLLNVTTIAGGWYFGSPQATRQATRKMINTIVAVLFDGRGDDGWSSTTILITGKLRRERIIGSKIIGSKELVHSMQDSSMPAAKRKSSM